jgi:hypothetical protein
MKHKKMLAQNTAKIKQDPKQTRIKSKYDQPITFCNATTRVKMTLANKYRDSNYSYNIIVEA